MKHEDIVARALNDPRSQAEIFESMKQRIQKREGGALSDKEAIEATQRLIGVFQVFADMYDTKQKQSELVNDEKSE